MASLGDLSVTVGAKIDGFEKSMGTVSQRLNAIDRDASKAFSGFDKLGGRLESIGTSLSAAITLPLVGISAAAVKVAGDFEGSFNRVSALGGITGTSLDKLKTQAIDLGAKTAFSAQQAADGMAVFASAGFDAEKIYAAMPGTLSLAAAGQITIAESATLVKDALGQFGLAASDTQRIADVLAQASLDTSAKMGDLGSTLTFVGPQARQAGQSLEETVAAIIALDAAGLRGEKAGTGLRGVLGSLLGPSSEARAEIEGLGVSISNSAGNVRPLSEIIEQFREKLANLGGDTERSRVLFEIFGREASNAASVLINTGGPALDAFEQKLLNNGNAADRVAKQLNQGFNYQMDQLKGSVETAGIVLGNALLPAVNLTLSAFTSFVNNAILPVVSGFNALPDSVKLGAIAIAGLAAATGPAIFIVGQLVSSVASIGAAATSMASILAKQPALLATIASSFGYAAVAAGLFAGALLFGAQFRQLGIELSTAAEKVELNIGAWARLKEAFGSTDTTKVAADIKYAGQACRESAADVLEMELAWKNFTDKFTFAALLEAITGPLGALTASVRGLGDTFEQFGGKYVSMEQAASDSAARLQKSVGDAMKAQLNAAMADIDSQKKRVAESERLTKGTDAYREAVDKEKEAVKKSTAEARIHEQALRELGLWVDKTETATRKWIDSQPVLAAKIRLTEAEYKKTIESLVLLEKHLENVKFDVSVLYNDDETVTFVYALRELGNELAVLHAGLGSLGGTIQSLPPMPPVMGGTFKELEAIGAAYGRLGVTTTGELKRIAAQHQADFNTIKGSGIATARELEAVWLKWLESAANAAHQAGEEIPIEIEGILNASTSKTKDGLKEQETAWGNFTKQVSTIVSDLGKDLAAGAVNLFKGLLGFDDFNKNLKAESEQLQAELTERSQIIEQFQQDTAAAISSVESKYAEQLAKETGEVRDQLQARQQEYAAYVSDTAAKLETLRGKEAARLAEEQGDLADKLRDKEAEYERYVGSVADKEQDIRKRHEEQLSAQLRSLQDNLADRVQAYEDFVADASTKMSRIGGDLNESIRDATRSTGRRIEDEDTDFARDTEKLNEDLRKAEAKGDKDQVAIIRRNLEQRQADHQRTIARLREDLAEHTRDAKIRAEEQTADLKTQLERRKRDHEEYITENAIKQQEITAQHREDQAEQLADLHASLAERTAALIAFREKTALDIEAAAVASAARFAAEEAQLQTSLDAKTAQLAAYEAAAGQKIDDLTAKYQAKQAEEIAALQLGLANKLTEYDTYRAGVEQKLQELEDAHKGPLDRIREMFGGIFESASNAILRLVSEEVLGKLVKNLAGLATDVLPGLGKAAIASFGGIVGAAADVGKAIANLFGGASGIAGIAGGGAQAIGDASSAVSGIVGAGGQAAGAAGSAANAAAGIAGQAAGMGFSAISGIITGAASAISGIIGNFQNAKQETTLNAIEHEVRFSQIHLLAILETGVNVFMAELPSIRGLTQQFLDQHAWRIHDVWTVLTEIRDMAMIPSLADPLLAGTGGSITVVVNLDGNEVGRAIVNRSELAGGAIP